MKSRQPKPAAIAIYDSPVVPTATTPGGAVGYLLVLLSILILTSAPGLALVLGGTLVMAATRRALDRPAIQRRAERSSVTDTARKRPDTGRSHPRR